MNIKVNKKNGTVIGSQNTIKRNNFFKTGLLLSFVKRKKAVPDSLFLLSLKFSVTWCPWEGNDITYISHPCNKLNHTLKPKTES